MPPHRPDADDALALLADVHGVVPTRPARGGAAGGGAAGSATPEDTVRRVLNALGVPASTDEEVRESLAQHRRQWRPLPEVVRARTGRGARVEALVPLGCQAEATVLSEAGRERSCRIERHDDQALEIGGDRLVPVTVVVPGDLPPGRHLLTLSFEVSGVTSPLLVAPQVLPPVHGGPRAWGVVGDVSAVVSQHTAEQGAQRGDLGDLAELVSWVGADLGGDFVLASTPSSAWSPGPSLSRVRANELPGAARTRLQTDGAGDAERALRAVYAVPPSPRHERAFAAFCERGGQGLVNVSTWRALARHHGDDPAAWPLPLRDAGSEDVAEAREQAAEDVDFYRWCQWAADRQLAEAAREANAVGMRIGVVAPVTAPRAANGALAWVHEVAPVSGIRLGEPPADGLPGGRVTDQRPWRPGTLAELGGGPLFDQLELARHCGGLLLHRPVDWFRQWWVPEGLDPSAGTWVRQDHETLLAAVGIAAHRQGAVVLADLSELAEHEARSLLAQGVVPLSRDGAKGGVRGIDLAEIAGGRPWTIEGLAASPAVRRTARRLTRS